MSSNCHIVLRAGLTTRSAIGVAFVLFAILAITLWPTVEARPLPSSYDSGSERRWLADGILNVCLFVPFGIAAGWRSRAPLAVVLVGLLLSAVIEMLQVIVPGRDPAFSDLIFNTVGSALGAVIGWRPHYWCAPDPRGSLTLMTLTLVVVGGVLVATSVLLAPFGSSLSTTRSGDDLLLEYTSRAAQWGFDEPDRWVRGAFSGIPNSTGSDKRLSVRRVENRLQVEIEPNRTVIAGSTIAEGWALLVYPNAIARRWGPVINALWLFILCVPVGFWARGSLLGIGALAVVALLFLTPRIMGIAGGSSLESGGGVMGFVTGAVLAEIVTRRTRRTCSGS